MEKKGERTEKRGWGGRMRKAEKEDWGKYSKV